MIVYYVNIYAVESEFTLYELKRQNAMTSKEKKDDFYIIHCRL